jgi:hypothetical protein
MSKATWYKQTFMFYQAYLLQVFFFRATTENGRLTLLYLSDKD